MTQTRQMAQPADVPSEALRATGITHCVKTGLKTHLTLLDGVDLSIGAGESVAIMGRSGSGKTTLLSVLGLMLRPDEGRVWLRGQDTSTLNDSSRARLRGETLGFVFQGYSLVPHLTAAENVALPLSYGARPARGERARVAQMLDAVGLAGMSKRYPRHLSGGEQQRVAIARALVRRPHVVLADEPTGALDVEAGDQVLSLLRQTANGQGSALVIVTHDPTVARAMSRVVHLTRGSLNDTGDTDA